MMFFELPKMSASKHKFGHAKTGAGLNTSYNIEMLAIYLNTSYNIEMLAIY